MNERDSEGVKGLLLERGYHFTDNIEEAEVIFLNTCSVRQHAEDRVFGRSGILSRIKNEKPDTVVGVLGCMAQEHGKNFFKRMPSLDLVCGPGNIREIPEILERLFEKRARITALDRINDTEYSMDNMNYRSHSVKASVNIMSGCDHKCTYCIVPMTRGIERSRPSSDIVSEVKNLVERGFKEILLLGQNVNCYGKKLGENIDFADLLYKIDREAKPERLRFISSHPKDAHPRLFQAMRDLPSVCEHLHLPFQSGSSRILRRMKREHTREWFLDRMNEYKAIVPNGDITTDIIVGFCGETNEDFEFTKSLMQEVQFSLAFIFKYSERPGTPASKLPDDVPEEVKSARHQDLLELQRRITREQNTDLIGQEVEVLFEMHQPGENSKAFGRTRQFRPVAVNSSEPLQGTLRRVAIREVKHETLVGEVV